MGFLFTLLFGVILGGGWLFTHFNLQTAVKRNSAARERILQLEHIVELRKRELVKERERFAGMETAEARLEEINSELKTLESNYTAILNENTLMEKTLISIRQRVNSREYMGNALSKIITGYVDKVVSPSRHESAAIAEGAKTILTKAKRAVNG